MSRNKKLQTPISLLMKNQETAKRKNCAFETEVNKYSHKKNLLAFIEKLIKSDPTRLDSKEKLAILENMENDNFEGVRNLIYKTDRMSGLGTTAIMQLLEQRNYEGM